MQQTSDLNIVNIIPLTTPAALKNMIPMNEAANRTVVQARETIKKILDRQDKRLLAVVGPCSIHDEKAALEYADRMVRLAEKIRDRIYLVMRVYFEKPRTSVGWKGFINDPDLNETYDIEKGLRLARSLLLRINEKGLSAATEFLDPITPQYIADLISWGAIGARTTESQTHREMASGLSMPVGLKNGTDGNLETALNAMQSTQAPHHFLGIDQDSRVSIIKTRGNPYGHMVLRGGKRGSNFDAASIEEAEKALRKANFEPAIVVDCSHANSDKAPDKQEIALKDIVRQILNGNQSILGVMIESHLFGGNQPISGNMAYGVSVTDQCLDWGNTERILMEAADQLSRRPA